MKKMDKDGLLLCKLQGDIFENSLNYVKTSSEIFIRRFMNSNIVKEMDSLAFLDDTLSVNDVYDLIELEYGESNYGKVKYHTEALFWIGYIYRYFAYTYELSSRQVYKIIKPKELNELYYPYHTLDCEQAIERILEAKEISFDQEEQNTKLLKLIRKKAYENGIVLKPITTQYDMQSFQSYKVSDSSYSSNQSNRYVEQIHSKRNISLSIIYKSDVIGEIQFKNIENNCAVLDVHITDDTYKEKDIEPIILTKALDYGKHSLLFHRVFVDASKSDKRKIQVFKKNGFTYKDENDDSIYLYKNI